MSSRLDVLRYERRPAGERLDTGRVEDLGRRMGLAEKLRRKDFPCDGALSLLLGFDHLIGSTGKN